MKPRLGYLAEITARQVGRAYFVEFPIGTKFIIIEIIDLPTYDLRGYFLNVNPQQVDGNPYFHGYINRGTWKIIGPLHKNIHHL